MSAPRRLPLSWTGCPRTQPLGRAQWPMERVLQAAADRGLRTDGRTVTVDGRRGDVAEFRAATQASFYGLIVADRDFVVVESDEDPESEVELVLTRAGSDLLRRWTHLAPLGGAA